ncbi:hypothetical protein ISS07_04440 [Candidatus Woesearchaeota archaeon]|nr:hypothetical protein [Candidatus Woesearchaeota archaeon]
MVLHLVKEVRDLNRFKEILLVLFEEGFDYLIERTKLRHHVQVTKKIRKTVEEKKKNPVEKRLRLTLERLGPTFIKFGQVLSVRPDLIPKRYIKELEKLQDDVPAFPFSIVKETIKNELGKNIEDIFTKFDKKPIASASISQVHKATLKNGKQVAVKVQRPDVRKLMETDLEIMFYVTKLLEHHFSNIKRYNPVRIVEEFSRWTEQELDFRKEAIHAKKFGRNFANSKTVKIPKVYSEYVTSKILVLEFIEGIELHNVKKLKKNNIDVRKIVKEGFEAILTQVFRHGFFHADPHPGNILITKDNKIAFLDFGIVGRFDEKLKNKSIDLFFGIINNDTEKIVDILVDISNSPIEDTDDLSDEISDIVESLQEADITKVKISYVLEGVMDTALKYGLKVPMPFVLFGKTVVTLEGIALEYDPKLKLVKESRPFIEKLIVDRYNPVNMANSFMKDMFKIKKYATQIPEQTSRVLKRLEKGSIKVDIEDSDIMRLSTEIDKTGNRIAYSMLIAALLIVGALTINVDAPALFDMPLVPFFSFIIAIILSFFVLISILKEKNYVR